MYTYVAVVLNNVCDLMDEKCVEGSMLSKKGKNYCLTQKRLKAGSARTISMPKQTDISICRNVTRERSQISKINKGEIRWEK